MLHDKSMNIITFHRVKRLRIVTLRYIISVYSMFI